MRGRILSLLAVAATLPLLACSAADGGGSFEEPGATNPPTESPETDGGAPGEDLEPDAATAPTDGAAPADTGTKDSGTATDTAQPAPDTGPVDPGPPPSDPPVAGMVLASNLSIAEVAFFQGVKVSVAKAGAKVATRVAPVIAGREALVRVFVTPKAGWSAHAIVGELKLISASGTFTYAANATPTAASTDATLASSINFNVPMGAIAPDTKYSVSLWDASTTANGDARYPATGEETLDAKSTGESLQIVIVPVKYDADGSGRLPDTSPAQIELYRKAFHAMYPAKKVEVTVRAPWAYAGVVSPNGAGMNLLLQAVVKLRAADRAPKGTYYYGAFAGKTSFSTWCGSGSCTTGLCGLLTYPSDATGRACVGIGYTGPQSANTAAHEVGHAHGRGHAPCGGVSDYDSKFPYSGGVIGAWGWDVVNKKLIDPKVGKDFMSYCSPEWISDYTFNALATRMATVAASPYVINAAAPAQYRFVDVGADGALTWGDVLTLDEPPLAEPHTVTWQDEGGRVLGSATGQYYPYGDLPGGYMLVPFTAPSSATVLEVSGLSPRVQTKLALERVH